MTETADNLSANVRSEQQTEKPAAILVVNSRRQKLLEILAEIETAKKRIKGLWEGAQK